MFGSVCLLFTDSALAAPMRSISSFSLAAPVPRISFIMSSPSPTTRARTASAISSFVLQALDAMGSGLKIKELTPADVLTDFAAASRAA
jgi:hypothetical protein